MGDFVKHGASEATIEIELRKDGKKYTSNPIIKALIRKDGNKMSFTLNGKPSNRKVCQDVAKSFSIQIDNLCQFLPQDRVVEFAALSPVELLKSTQRAIASEQMIQWHGELTTLGKDLKTVEQNTKVEIDNLKNLETRQRMQEADVQRLRERDGIKEDIERLETVRPLVQFATVRNELAVAKERHKTALDELRELTAREAPSLRAVNEKEEYRNTVKMARDSLDRKRNTAERAATSKHDDIESCDRQVTLHEQAMNDRKKNLRDAKSEIKRLEGIIICLRKEFDQGQPQFDLPALQEQIRELIRGQNSAREEITSIKAAQKEADAQVSAKDKEAEDLQRQIEKLDSLTGRQEQKLKKASLDTWKAWEWVQGHQDKFQKPILGPPIIECSVNNPDPKYADMLEALIQQGDMFTFTAQTPTDQREFHRLAKDVYGWKRINTRCAPDASRFKSPMNENQMRSAGFEGWAKDYIQGPPAIVAMLCEAANLHRVGICPREQSRDQFAAAEQGLVSGWATPKATCRFMRRAEYGAGATSTTTRDLRKASFWTDQPIDSGIKDRMQANIDSLKQDTEVLKEASAEDNKKSTALATKYKDLQAREVSFTCSWICCLQKILTNL